MKNILLTIIFLSALACSKSDDESNINVEGNYIGTFERKGTISNVEIDLKNSAFTGKSDTEKFPAICRGSFEMSHNTVTFRDECPWTAEFDWSLILSGKWDVRFKKNTLILTNSLGDSYHLTRKRLQ